MMVFFSSPGGGGKDKKEQGATPFTPPLEQFSHDLEEGKTYTRIKGYWGMGQCGVVFLGEKERKAIRKKKRFGKD